MAGSTAFISYRREDSAGYAGRLFDRLVDRLGRDHVFRDIDSIAPGENFADAIRKRLAASAVLLVVIGPRWLSVTDSVGRRRLEEETDLVRTEIELALDRKIRVIPVLLPGAHMPGANELPPSLAALSQFQAVEIRESHFDHDVAQLVKAIKPGGRSRSLRALRRRRGFYPAVFGAVGALTAIVIVWLNPLIFTSPERARLRIAAMGLPYDAGTFVRAAREGDSATIKLFLRAGIQVDETPLNDTAIVAAAEKGHLPVVKALAEAGADIEAAVVAAGRASDQAVLDYLLSRNPKQRSLAGALSIAAGQGEQLDVVRKLLDRGVPADADWGGTPLMGAAYYGNAEIVELLLQRGADVRAVNREGETPLHYAARASSPSVEIVGRLLARGAPVNAQDHAGRTPLMNALENREVTQLLLAHGADVRLRTKDGSSALLYAVGRDVAWVIKPLLDRGAEVNAQNDRGETPLMWATGAVDSVDKAQIVQILIDNGADVNLADRKGNSALMFAAEKGLTSSIRILLREGARAGASNTDGRTALAMAKAAGRERVVKLLSGAR